jgi:hypothetical protein
VSSFGILHWLILAAIVWICVLAARKLLGIKAEGPQTICTSCGSRAPSKTVTRGSFLIEVILWLCFIIPGVIYSLWRLTTRSQACSACGATSLVPADSPVGRKLAKDLDA